MPTSSQVNRLSDKRYVTVVLRFVLDRRHRLVRGEVVDSAGKSQGQFAGWRELIRIMRSFLTSQ